MKKPFVAFKQDAHEIPLHKKQFREITGPEALELYLKLVGKATRHQVAKYFGLSKRQIDRIFADLSKTRKIYCDLRRTPTYALDPRLIR